MKAPIVELYFSSIEYVINERKAVRKLYIVSVLLPVAYLQTNRDSIDTVIWLSCLHMSKHCINYFLSFLRTVYDPDRLAAISLAKI